MIDDFIKGAGFLGRFEEVARNEIGMGSVPYGAVPSKENLCWLIPLKNSDTSAAAFSLYQPSLVRARLLKKMAVLAAKSGITGMIFRDRVYFSAEDSGVRKIFDRDDLQYAIFAGTKGRHRKITVQVMDGHGAILGYIKVSDSDEIDELLNNETTVLKRLSELKISEGLYPRVLFSGAMNGTHILVLDSLKNGKSTFSSKLSNAHISFLAEIFRKTAESGRFRESGFYRGLLTRIELLNGTAAKDFAIRGQKILDFLDGRLGGRELPFGICHRDFTPWNTFFHGPKLYAFDWEYAKEGYPPLLDLFHFIIQNGVIVQKLEPNGLLKKIAAYKDLIGTYINAVGIAPECVTPLLLCYLVDVSLLYIEREKGSPSEDVRHISAIRTGLIDLILGGRAAA
ncbi:MAG: phosphotransferase [Candidatus Sulfobium sp.]